MGLLSVKEAADRLKSAPRSVHYWCEVGLLKAVKVGRIWVIEESAVDAFVKPKRGPAPQPKVPKPPGRMGRPPGSKTRRKDGTE